MTPSCWLPALAFGLFGLASACTTHASPPPSPPQVPQPTGFVRVSPIDDFRGQPAFRVETGTQPGPPALTYVYHRLGAGFASLIDRDGHDWISWNEGAGPEGAFRGIPNLGLGRCCHPGYGTDGELVMQSELARVTAEEVVIRSIGAGFELTWTITPDTATLAVLRADKSYWFLYEGTPGGHIDAQDTLWLAAAPAPLQVERDKHTADLPGPEWVAFTDGLSTRTLVLVHHEDDAHMDTYFRMGEGTGGMTVWGFGRERGDALMTGVNHMTLGLRETRDPSALRAWAERRATTN